MPFRTKGESIVSYKLQNFLNILKADFVNFVTFCQKKGFENCNFVFKSVSKGFIHKELLRFNHTNSTGFDDITARFIELEIGQLFFENTHNIRYIVNSSFHYFWNCS